ncbi:MAG: hypothetical protein LBJ63_10210 [Prevotellaceae bacterium]|jgi:hypothetical protein|nr:hypothetical protein [Prevotellaceae bacterium]
MEETNNIQENRNTDSTNILKDIISGKIFINKNIQKHLKYIFFLFFIAVFYIGYCYKVETTAIENKKLDRELMLLRVEYVNQLNKLSNAKKKSEVIKKLQDRHSTLKESKTPFKRIKTK